MSGIILFKNEIRKFFGSRFNLLIFLSLYLGFRFQELIIDDGPWKATLGYLFFSNLVFLLIGCFRLNRVREIEELFYLTGFPIDRFQIILSQLLGMAFCYFLLLLVIYLPYGIGTLWIESSNLDWLSNVLYLFGWGMVSYLLGLGVGLFTKIYLKKLFYGYLLGASYLLLNYLLSFTRMNSFSLYATLNDFQYGVINLNFLSCAALHILLIGYILDFLMGQFNEHPELV